MKTSRYVVGVLTVGFLGVASAHGDEDLRTGQVQPRTGVMSEVVVKEKVKTYGYSAAEVTSQGDTWVVRAQREGQPVEFKINALTGALQESNSGELRLTPQATNVIQAQPQRTPWVARAIKFDQIGIRGLSPP